MAVSKPNSLRKLFPCGHPNYVYMIDSRYKIRLSDKDTHTRSDFLICQACGAVYDAKILQKQLEGQKEVSP